MAMIAYDRADWKRVFRQAAGLLLLASLGVSGWSLTLSNIVDDSSKVKIIFDTDMGGDYDDVGALGMLHALEKRGEIEILATVSSNLYPLSVPAIEIINSYYGRPDIPIGMPVGKGYYQHSRELHYQDSLMQTYPDLYKQPLRIVDAVDVYRQVLADQPDESVVIVTVGFTTNMKNLLQSKPDQYSELTGKQLVAKKVKSWVAMGGGFPEGFEVNIKRDAVASQYAIDNWPTQIVFSGFEIGNKISTGLDLIENGPEDSPIRYVYQIGIGIRPNDAQGRKSWDQTALLVAARGYDPYYDINRGWFVTRESGHNGWKDDPKGSHLHLVEKMDPKLVTMEIEKLMMY